MPTPTPAPLTSPIPLQEELMEPLDTARSSRVRTILAMAMLGMFVGSNTYYLAATGQLRVSGSYGRGIAASLLSIVICTAAGVALSVRRGAASGLLKGSETQWLGQRVVGLVFERLGSAATVGSPQALPLAAAEKLLREGIAALGTQAAQAPAEDEIDARLLRALRGQLLWAVERVTVAQVRQQAAPAENPEHPATVQLGRVREALVPTADGTLREELQRSITRATLLYVGIAVFASTLAGVVIRAVF